jgi:hypothetical protein
MFDPVQEKIRQRKFVEDALEALGTRAHILVSTSWRATANRNTVELTITVLDGPKKGQKFTQKLDTFLDLTAKSDQALEQLAQQLFAKVP